MLGRPLLLPGLGALLLTVACTAGPSADDDPARGSAAPPERPVARACVVTAPPSGPTDGIWWGVSLDPAQDTLADYSRRLRRTPAVSAVFAPLPLGDEDVEALTTAVRAARTQGATVLVTLEPRQGLAAVDPPAAERLAALLAAWNETGVAAIVRFAPDMNGTWYPWGQQPAKFKRAFRLVARAVQRQAPGSATMWSPAYGGGYPFAGGVYHASPGSRATERLDASSDGRLGAEDDPYAPYYPGDRAVDWVGMAIFHWGTAYPWGENEVPSPGKLVAQLRGRYRVPGTDETAVPDFHERYAVRRDKPLAVASTGAFYDPRAGGAQEVAVKGAWLHQVTAPDLAEKLPGLRLVTWFEWAKREAEVGARVRWGAARPPMLGLLRSSVPRWARFAAGRPPC